MVQVRVFLSYWGNPDAPRANESLGTRRVRVTLHHARGAAPVAAALAVVGPGTTDPRAAWDSRAKLAWPGLQAPMRPPTALRARPLTQGCPLGPRGEASPLGCRRGAGWSSGACPKSPRCHRLRPFRWEAMGSPAEPNAAQRVALERAAQVVHAYSLAACFMAAGAIYGCIWLPPRWVRSPPTSSPSTPPPRS